MHRLIYLFIYLFLPLVNKEGKVIEFPSHYYQNKKEDDPSKA